MPIYEYECQHCGHLFDRFVNQFKNSDQYKCPECGKKADKIISSTGFILKGNGWARDNYASKKG